MNLPEQWDRVLSGMRRRIGFQDVEIWLESCVPVRLEDGVLWLQALNSYYSSWILENYLDALVSECAVELEQPVQIRFLSQDDAQEDEGARSGSRPRPPRPKDSEQPPGNDLNPNQTFASFVVGECNRFAHAAATSVSESPANAYNPLFIYGGTGLGKTHLMHAIGHAMVQQHRLARVIYVTSEDFMNQMIDSIRYKRTEEFRARYRKRASVLLVDDIQFLSGRDRTQEEFFHTFNALIQAGRQIVLTADVLPRNIDKLEPRLRTRFEGGLMADIQAPDKETLLAILLQKSDQLGLVIPSNLAEEIANIVAGNIRELEGLVKRIHATCQFHHTQPTLAFVREQLGDTFTPQPVNLSVSEIIAAVARYHNITSADIVGKKRTRALSKPRHIAMFLAREALTLSYPDLGKEFGGRDHSTVQYAVKKVRKQLRDDADLAYRLRLISQTLGVHLSVRL